MSRVSCVISIKAHTKKNKIKEKKSFGNTGAPPVVHTELDEKEKGELPRWFGVLHLATNHEPAY